MTIGQHDHAQIRLLSRKLTSQIFEKLISMRDNAKLCRGDVNQDSQVFVRVVDDLQKKFQP